MDAWQTLRLQRAKEHDIFVTRVDCTDDSFICSVQGLSDEYEVEICQDAELWPPNCTCEDHFWRPDLLCKHILLCFKLMGVEDDLLSDCYWEPDQRDLYEYLCNAPDCVGGSISEHDGKNKSTNVFPDSRLYAA